MTVHGVLMRSSSQPMKSCGYLPFDDTWRTRASLIDESARAYLECYRNCALFPQEEAGFMFAAFTSHSLQAIWSISVTQVPKWKRRTMKSTRNSFFKKSSPSIFDVICCFLKRVWMHYINFHFQDLTFILQNSRFLALCTLNCWNVHYTNVKLHQRNVTKYKPCVLVMLAF